MNKKKEYSKPLLTTYGDAKKITKQEGNLGHDGYSGSNDDWICFLISWLVFWYLIHKKKDKIFFLNGSKCRFFLVIGIVTIN